MHRRFANNLSVLLKIRSRQFYCLVFSLLCPQLWYSICLNYEYRWHCDEAGASLHASFKLFIPASCTFSNLSCFWWAKRISFLVMISFRFLQIAARNRWLMWMLDCLPSVWWKSYFYWKKLQKIKTLYLRENILHHLRHLFQDFHKWKRMKLTIINTNLPSSNYLRKKRFKK